MGRMLRQLAADEWEADRMRPMHEQFLTAIADERRRISSRRGFLTGTAKVAGGGALAMAFAGVPVALGARGVAAQDFEDDLDIANYALTLEHLEHAFYRDGLKMFDEAAFKEDNRPGNLRENLEAIRGHEEAHVDFLTEAISEAGGEPVEEAEYDFGYDDIAGFLEVAMALENVGVSAYAGAAPSIKDEGILAAALGVHSVEARHAAYLNARNGESPFPDAFDEARTREEVLELAGPFIAGESTSAAKSTGGTTVTVDIDDYEFLPAELEIAAGTTVTWTNVGQVPHTATAEDETFDTGVLGRGKSGSYTFEEPGTYPYVCTLHPTDMKATVVVT